MISKLFVGYDAKEELAYKVCRFSALRRTKIPLKVVPLYLDVLKREGLYTRKHYLKGEQKIDVEDGKPFSTEFSFSRFLVPFLAHEGWVLFCDSDFLFMADLMDLTPLLDEQYAVMVVKHNYVPKEKIKMDGVAQTSYPRKNWSSFVVWNLSHIANKKLTITDVNKKPGSWLHGFHWLPDEMIGELPVEWNWLEGVYQKGKVEPKAIHYTRGGPWFDNWKHVDYADEWNAEHDALRMSTIH